MHERAPPYSRPDGVHDIGPVEFREHQRIEARLLECFARFGYEQVRVATMEYRDLYAPERVGYDLFHHLVLGRIGESRSFPVGTGDAAGSGDSEEVHEVVLRPDFTTPIARAFATEVLAQGGRPLDVPYRWSYAGQVFRDWRPSSVRQREFRQVGVELLGITGPHADAEVLTMACDAIDAVGVAAWQLHVGHAGLYRSILRDLDVPEAALGVTANLVAQLARVHVATRAGEAGFRRFLRGSLQRLRELTGDNSEASTVPEERGNSEEWRARLPERYESHFVGQLVEMGLRAEVARRALTLALPASGVVELLDRAPTASAESRAFGAELAQVLGMAPSGRAVAPVLTPAASRGIAYYTGLTFEIHADSMGTADTDVCGGGRYGTLPAWIYRRAAQTSALDSGGDPGAPAASSLASVLTGVGLAFGIERLAAALSQTGNLRDPDRHGAYVVVRTPELAREARDVARILRGDGLAATLELPEPYGSVRDLRTQLGRASGSNARWAVIIAEDEHARGVVRLRDLSSGAEVELDLVGAVALMTGRKS